ncbi:MAG: hypothetical protein ACFFCS_02510 [Candidatus Hodarchaeota archaeon]
MSRKKKVGTKAAFGRFIPPLLLFSAVMISNGIIWDYAFNYESRIRQALSGIDINLNVEFDHLNTSSWIVPSFQAEDFVFEVETWSNTTPWRDNTTYSVYNYSMGTTDWFKDNCTEWGEWGYAFHHLTGGAVDGAGVEHWGGYPTPPNNKQEAYDYMRQYVVNKTTYLYNNTRPWISFNGHYPYHHYAAEFGFDKIGTEIGENMESYQMLLAFNRGAARQYNLPWFVDFSAWYGPGITDYNEPPFWGEYSGVNNGHSLSLFRRSYYMSYFAGTSRLVAEGGSVNFFYHRVGVDPYGLMQLTPLGEIGREFAHFSQNNTDRGIPYTPFALFIDELHGTTGLGGKQTFNSIDYTKGDWMTYKLLDTLFPGGWIQDNTETCQLVKSDFGDTFDIILQNASQEVLSSYPVIVMSGDLALDANETQRLAEYVSEGGTLIVNSAYIDMLNPVFTNSLLSSPLSFSFFDSAKLVPINNGNGGNIILYGPNFEVFKLKIILQEILPLLNPFRLSSSTGGHVPIEFLINRNPSGWVLTLINNAGVTKSHHDPPQIDPSQSRGVKVELSADFLQDHMQGQLLAKVENWITNETLWESGGDDFTETVITIGPGDLSVLEFEFS